MEELLDFIDDKIDKSVFAAKFTLRMCEFEEKCEYTFRYLPHVVHLFQWFGLDTTVERASALQHLGYMLLRELNNMQEVYDLRKLQLCDEHCDRFEKWLRMIDDHIKKFCQFSDEATELLASVDWDVPKRRLFVQLNQAYARIENIVCKHNSIEISSEKCNELNLHYDPENMLTEPMGIRKFFYFILHFLTLLALPSHRDETDKELVVFLRSSFDMFRNSDLGKSWQERYAEKLQEEIADQDDEQQLEIVKNRKKGLTAEIREYLEKFGVGYYGIDKDKSAGRLCRQLYERLNGIHTDDEKEQEIDCDIKPVKMKNKDLRFYFVKEVHMQYLTRKINELNEALERKKHVGNRKIESNRKNPVTTEEKKKSWDGIFIVDENKLATCFSKLYDSYFGEKRKNRLEGKCDQSLFFAYLYLLVEKEQLGKENFAENTRKPFFEFIKEKVVRETDKTMRTFHNRVDELQSFRNMLLSKDENYQENPLWKNSIHCKNFHGIRGNFQKTGYFIELERLKKSNVHS